MQEIDEYNFDMAMDKNQLRKLYALIEDAAKSGNPILFDDTLYRLDYLQIKLVGKGALWITNLYWKDNENNIYNPVLEAGPTKYSYGWFVKRSMNIDWSGSGRIDMFREKNRYI